MAKTVRVIPASPKIFRSEVTAEPRRRRTAGYARVSTDHEEQASSYEMQMAHYKNYIESRADWDFVGMYSDEGISGTNTKKRDGFNQMIEDALAGKIDLIITKSVSRFARNTVDSLQNVRKLKENGVEIYFEKENIWTFDTRGDVLRSDLIQCNDGGQSVRRLDIWAFALWLSFCSHFFSSVIYGGRAIGGAYSINDEYPINDCFRVSLIGYGQSLKKFPYNTFK